MNLRVMLPAALLATGTGACDPLFSMDIRQSLVPAPSADCVSAALERSPHVASVEPAGKDARDGYRVSFRDVRWTGALTSAPVADSARVLTLSYTWLGHARPGPREELRMKTAAERVVAEVREACAPGSPSGPECVMMIPFAPSKPCRTAA